MRGDGDAGEVMIMSDTYVFSFVVYISVGIAHDMALFRRNFELETLLLS